MARAGKRSNKPKRSKTEQRIRAAQGLKNVKRKPKKKK